MAQATLAQPIKYLGRIVSQSGKECKAAWVEPNAERLRSSSRSQMGSAYSCRMRVIISSTSKQ